MHLYGGTLPDQHATLHPSLLRVSMPEVSHSCSYCGAAVGCLLGLLVVRGRYAKKRLTAPYIESSVSANTASQGETPDWRQFPPWGWCFGYTLLPAREKRCQQPSFPSEEVWLQLHSKGYSRSR